MPARIHDAVATAALIGWQALVDALKVAAIEADDGAIACPERIVMPMGDGAVLMSMPAAARDLAIHKLITVAPGNGARGLPTIIGTVTLVDPVTGEVLAVLDGPTVTGRRTAAISMLAIACFAAKPIDRVLLIGTGTQARHHVEALAALHPGARVRVRGTSPDSAARFCAMFGSFDVAPAKDSDDVSVVITCSSSRTPVYREAANADRLVIAVGSFQPEAAEIAAATVRASAVVVDDPRGAPHEAGDLIRADVDWSRVTSLADHLKKETGPSIDGPVLFKSVGCAAWDLAAARGAWRRGSI